MTNVQVNFSKNICKIKDMNSVNNGPSGFRGMNNYDSFKAAKIPYARTHDASFYSGYGSSHTIDMIAIFPDFEADENDPASYDFHLTDEYLDNIEAAGTKVFYRLGNKIEHESKKYGSLVPTDFAKWARIAEHLIRHETEGWANGFRRDIEYWEIWNEPDLSGHQCWTGDIDTFCRFFDVAIRHLKSCFPHLKFGGPALSWVGKTDFWEAFRPYLVEKKMPLDFFSFHRYLTKPESVRIDSQKARELLDGMGYTQTEIILNEWNYVRAWTPADAILYSYQVIGSLKGSALVSSAMICGQDSPLDHLMYYDARPSTAWNGMFDYPSFVPKKPYYSFLAYSKLAECGTEVQTECDGSDVYALSAVDATGKCGTILLTRYADEESLDGNGIPNIDVRVDFSGLNLSTGAKLTYSVLDRDHDLTVVGGETFGSGSGYHVFSLPMYSTILIEVTE